jgi:PAS domain S-box-containing protein
VSRAPLPKDEAARLASLRALRVLDSLPEPQYDDLVQVASAICGTPIALVSLVDEGRQWFKARVGLEARETPRDVAFCAHAILQPDLFVVNDAVKDERFRDNPLVTSAPTMRFYAGAPLLSPDGMPLGTLCVIDRVPRQLSAVQETALSALSRQVTRLLELRTQKAELEEANRRLVASEAQLRILSEELGESVTRFRTTFDQNAIGLTLLGIDGRFLSVNRAFLEMLGYEETELIGVHVSVITHPDDRVATAGRLAIPSNRLLNVAKRFVRKDGEIVWTEAVVRCVFDAAGRPLYWLSQIQNISARKESEKQRDAQFAMARVLAEASTLEEAAPRLLETLCSTGRWDIAVIWEIDESDGLLRCAALASVSSEYDAALDALRTLVAARGEGIAGRVWASGQPLWTDDASRADDAALSKKAAMTGMRAVLAIPVMVEGAPIGVVSLFSHKVRSSDSTTQALAEALSAQIGSFLTRKHAEAMQRRMVTVLENTSDFVAITDRHAKVLYVNRAGRALLEIPATRPVSDLKAQDYLPPWAIKLMGSDVREIARREGRWAGNFAYLTPSGREIPVSQVTIAPKGASGSTLFYASIARDITEAKKVERMKNEFVSTVSHELRTPLTSIRGALGLLEGGVVGQLDDAALEIVRIARTNSDRLIRLVNDMLDLEKIEAGKLDMVFRDVSAEALATSAVDSVRGMADQAGVGLVSEVPADLRVRVDFDRAVQVLTNLLSNAVKFSSRGTIVTLRARSVRGRARFEVVDQGPGIAPELRARLFQRFEQLDASDARAKGGTGLGLAISKAIVEQLGGTIGVDSVAGEGATFWIELAGVTSRPLSQRPGDGGRAAKILIVDDDPAVRTAVAHVLESLGVEILNAADGASAIQLVRSGAPDLIVLDVGVPRPDGFEVVSILQEDAARDTPLVVYTGRELSAADRHRLKLGETRFLRKSRDDGPPLLAIVRELLSRKEATP